MTIHELMRVHTHPFVYGMGEVFIEGLAEYFAVSVCRENKIPHANAYPDERRAMEALADAVGFEALAKLAFHGDVRAVQEAVDSIGPGSWKSYVASLRDRDFPAARKTLVGVKAANRQQLERREALDAALAEHLEIAERTRRDVTRAVERAEWGAEATKPQRRRIIGAQVEPGGTRLTIGAGGRDGIREGWNARVKLGDGRLLDVTVERVDTRTSQIRIPDRRDAEAVVGDVELSPGAE